MPKQQLILKIIALPVFIIFMAGLVYYKSATKNVENNGAGLLAINTLADTTVDAFSDSHTKKRLDTIRPLRRLLPSSKSLILTDERPLFIPIIKKQKLPGYKDSTRYIYNPQMLPIKNSTAKQSHN